MTKRIVVCCDGTWNTPDEQQHGVRTPTNVSKVALAVAPRGSDGIEQATYYHPGVGTTRSDKFAGGAFGVGLSHDVVSAYRYVVATYEPGDELYLFGFSRGAFTARSAAGFIRNCGILRPEHADRIHDAYCLYRNNNPTTAPRGIEATLFRQSYSYDAAVHFIGVWDTVGALGIPLSGIPVVDLINRRWQFHDTNLSSTVGNAFQALAIDERRGPFRPTLWTQSPDTPATQRLEQVWFAGVHCDVGGGYLDHRLSDITLRWMVDRARSCGLGFRPNAFVERGPASPDSNEPIIDAFTSIEPDILGQLHESRTGFYRLIRPYVRVIGVTDPRHEYVSSTAPARMKEDPSYRPEPLVAASDGVKTMHVDAD